MYAIRSYYVTVYTQDTSLGSITLKNDIYIKTLVGTSGSINLNSFSLNVLGDAQIASDVNLNNGIFNIAGSLIHSSGTLAINNGTLNVEQDFKIAGSFDGGISYGKLRMTQSGGRVNVEGNFVTDSIYAHTGYLTDGIFTLSGNFSQINSTEKFLISRYNFDSSDNFKIRNNFV